MNWISTTIGYILGVYIIAGYLFILYILMMFTTGGTTGIVLGNAAIDVVLHDTYYIIYYIFIRTL